MSVINIDDLPANKLEPHHIYIGNGGKRFPELKPSEWGNPFRAGFNLQKYTKLEALQLFKDYWRGMFHLHEKVHMLAGQDLVCHCKEGEPCHGHFLLDKADEAVYRMNHPEDEVKVTVFGRRLNAIKERQAAEQKKKKEDGPPPPPAVRPAPVGACAQAEEGDDNSHLPPKKRKLAEGPSAMARHLKLKDPKLLLKPLEDTYKNNQLLQRRLFNRVASGMPATPPPTMKTPATPPPTKKTPATRPGTLIPPQRSAPEGQEVAPRALKKEIERLKKLGIEASHRKPAAADEVDLEDLMQDSSETVILSDRDDEDEQEMDV